MQLRGTRRALGLLQSILLVGLAGAVSARAPSPAGGVRAGLTQEPGSQGPGEREPPRRGTGGPVDLAEIAGVWKPDDDLHHAAANGEIGKVRRFIEQGADVDLRHPEHGRTPLQGAANFGHLDTARLLIEAGADPDRGEERTSPLQVAAMKADAEMVRLLLKAGATVDLRPGGGDTALMLAASVPRQRFEHFRWTESDLVETVEALLAGGADVNLSGPMGVTPLIGASQEGYPRVVETLVRAGADLEQLTKPFGTSALLEAGMAGHPEVVTVLLDSGASWQVADRAGRTVVDWSWSVPELLDRLERAGADVSKARARAKAAHREVSEEEKARAIETLDELGFAFDDFGYERALRQAAIEAVRAFLAAGRVADSAMILTMPPLYSALRSCDRSDNEEIAHLLLEHGADPNLGIGSGHTPLMAAVQWCSLETIEAVIDAGAEIDARMKGSTAAELAKSAERQEAVDLLVARGATPPE